MKNAYKLMGVLCIYIYYCFSAESCPAANIPVVYDHNVPITDSEGEDLYDSFKCTLLSFSQQIKEQMTL